MDEQSRRTLGMSGCGLSCCSRIKYAWRNRLHEARSVALHAHACIATERRMAEQSSVGRCGRL